MNARARTGPGAFACGFGGMRSRRSAIRRVRSQLGCRGGGAGRWYAAGRELEIADVLSFIKRAGVRNTMWVTADVHYTAAHYYDPGKAVFQDFEPFWEFVSGPLHAGFDIGKRPV